MSKIIVHKKEINEDPKLSIIKAFRVTNKRAGEAKKRGPEGHEEYLQYCMHLRDLSSQADELGFHIWVNSNGATGHTYEKDYRETPDEYNDYERHEAEVQTILEAEENDVLSNVHFQASMPNGNGRIPN